MSNHPPCTCAGSGHCPRYGRLVTQREYEYCSGDCPADRPCSEELLAFYRAILRGEKPPAVALPQAQVAPAQSASVGAERLKTCRYRGRAVRENGAVKMRHV